jgi:serine/threonine protein kinase
MDDHFRAKVADFGMSKLFDEKRTNSEVVTNMLRTRGYLAPEWLLHTGITVKCDVYSYGMVLLEIVSGRKNVNPEKYYFPARAVQRMQAQTSTEIVDVRLQRLLISKDWM